MIVSKGLIKVLQLYKIEITRQLEMVYLDFQKSYIVTKKMKPCK